jgi:hypothetical protein
MPETNQKYFLGRKVKEERTITRGPNVEYGALYEASETLRQLYMRVGWMDKTRKSNPIGFSTEFLPAAWNDLSEDAKNKLDGVLVSSNFRTESVKIIFFDNE